MRASDRRVFLVFSYHKSTFVPVIVGGEADLSCDSRMPISAKEEWSQKPDLNRRPVLYESTALPTELFWPSFRKL